MFVLDTNVVSELRKAKAGKADRNGVAQASCVLADLHFVLAITILKLKIDVLLVLHRKSKQGALLTEWLCQCALPAFRTAFYR